jgi:hypothetical protein
MPGFRLNFFKLYYKIPPKRENFKEEMIKIKKGEHAVLPFAKKKNT